MKLTMVELRGSRKCGRDFARHGAAVESGMVQLQRGDMRATLMARDLYCFFDQPEWRQVARAGSASPVYTSASQREQDLTLRTVRSSFTSMKAVRLVSDIVQATREERFTRVHSIVRFVERFGQKVPTSTSAP